jgi:hypothetical protein
VRLVALLSFFMNEYNLNQVEDDDFDLQDYDGFLTLRITMDFDPSGILGMKKVKQTDCT